MGDRSTSNSGCRSMVSPNRSWAGNRLVKSISSCNLSSISSSQLFTPFPSYLLLKLRVGKQLNKILYFFMESGIHSSIHLLSQMMMIAFISLMSRRMVNKGTSQSTRIQFIPLMGVTMYIYHTFKGSLSAETRETCFCSMSSSVWKFKTDLEHSWSNIQ